MTRRGHRCKALISTFAALLVVRMAGSADSASSGAPALWRTERAAEGHHPDRETISISN
jgi:hypothetical protein